MWSAKCFDLRIARLVFLPARYATGTGPCPPSMPPTSSIIPPRKTPDIGSGNPLSPKILPLSFDNLATTGPNNLSMNDCCQPCIAVRRKLFTPGPLLVSERVKNSMLYDIALRHADFAYLVKFVRNALLQVARVDPDVYTSVLVNGSGTSAAEGTLRTILGDSKKKLIILDNGRFAKRIAEICKSSGINVRTVPVNLKTLQETLIACPQDIGGVMAVQCETSTGIVNPVDEIGDIVKKCAPESLYFVDATTSFGAIPVKMSNIDFMVGNACKSLQGVPGVAFVIAKRESLERFRTKQNLGLVLDIAAQHDELERSAMFRHTPPTHVMLAFKECLLEYSQEGGLQGRSARYKKNTQVLKEEMQKMGFKQLYKDTENPNGYIVTSFQYPNIPQFVFDEFSKRLSDAGHVICNDKQATAPYCFRIGSMGDINEDDIRALTNSIRNVCGDMRIELPLAVPVY